MLMPGSPPSPATEATLTTLPPWSERNGSAAWVTSTIDSTSVAITSPLASGTPPKRHATGDPAVIDHATEAPKPRRSGRAQGFHDRAVGKSTARSNDRGAADQASGL